MRSKEQIVSETCLTYLVKHLPKEIDRYYNLGDNPSCERVQWQLVTHMICCFKTLVSLDTGAQEGYKDLCKMIDKFEREN